MLRHQLLTIINVATSVTHYNKCAMTINFTHFWNKTNLLNARILCNMSVWFRINDAVFEGSEAIFGSGHVCGVSKQQLSLFSSEQEKKLVCLLCSLFLKTRQKSEVTSRYILNHHIQILDSCTLNYDTV